MKKGLLLNERKRLVFMSMFAPGVPPVSRFFYIFYWIKKTGTGYFF